MNKYAMSFVLTLLFGLSLVIFSSIGFAAEYQIIDVGTLGGYVSRPNDINNKGQIIGESYPVDNSGTHAYLWEKGSITDLGTTGIRQSSARSINDSGKIVGFGEYPDPAGDVGATYFAPTIFEKDTMVQLPTFTSTFHVDEAWSINNSSTIAGGAYIDGIEYGGMKAVIWEGGVVKDLGISPGRFNSYAMGINDSKQIIGVSSDLGPDDFYDPAAIHAWSYKEGKLDYLTSIDNNPDELVAPRDINEKGQIVGVVNVPDSDEYDFYLTHAYFWDGLKKIDIGAIDGLDTYTRGINNQGQVVGYRVNGHGYEEMAFLWDDVLGLRNLQDLIADPHWKLKAAISINDRGQIAGWGTYDGEERSFLLSPVPEPQTYLLFILGIGLFLLIRIRRPLSV